MQTRETRARNVAIVAMSLSLLLCRSLMGQEGLSTLRGTIIDSSGAVIPGVTVAAREVSTNITARTASTDAQGNYEMPGLKAANYQVTATQTGFKRAVVDDVMLQSNQVRRVDITLEVGEVTSEVTVSAAAEAIQTEQGKIGADFNAAKRYWDLPIPGNAFSGTYAVLAILPEVQRAPGDWGAPTFAGQGGNQVNMGQDGIKEETLKSNGGVREGGVLRHDQQERNKPVSWRSLVLSPELGLRRPKLLRGSKGQGPLPYHEPQRLRTDLQRQDVLLWLVERRAGPGKGLLSYKRAY